MKLNIAVWGTLSPPVLYLLASTVINIPYIRHLHVMGASILVGYILLYAESIIHSTEGYSLENVQFDMVNGGKPTLYSTREECHAALKELVFKKSSQPTYIVEQQKNGDLIAQSKRIQNNATFRGKVTCFEIWDAVGTRKD